MIRASGIDSWRRRLSAQEAAIADAVVDEAFPLGRQPAIIVIDAQNYMVGPPPGSREDYPSACGEPAVAALHRLAPLLEAARLNHWPVIYTMFVVRRDGADIGVYGRKRDLLEIEGWCLEGSEGAEISHIVPPGPGDLVFVKKKPSAFFGTPLLGYLIDRHVDLVLIAGGSTSNCVRATAVDSSSYNFRTAVLADCVFDRFDLSHDLAFFDMRLHYATLVRAEDVLANLAAGAAKAQSAPTPQCGIDPLRLTP